MSRRIDIGQSEYLIYNIVNEDTKAFFRPLDLLQSIHFFSKYTIRDNFITPKICTMVILIVFDTNIIYITQIISLLKIALDQWILDFKNLE
ncbi:uncharacterized protein LOC135083022 [Ostrinia nubilalis]|uniref:uncharacterized protein LOC135083022 n=1 Tax=Ostrinia nubilalis TaxID=29057 RepID=UPI0030825BE8